MLRLALISTAGWLLAVLPVFGDGSSGSGELRLSLDQSIWLALDKSRTLLNARHAREIQKFSLSVSEDRYRPRTTIGVRLSNDNRAESVGEVTIGPSLRILSGGEIRIGRSEPFQGDKDSGGTWTLGFSQPLMKGFGAGIDTAPLRLARLQESRNVLSYRNTVASVVESVIDAYHSLIRAHRAIAISRESLARSKRQLEINRALIRVGRMAEREIVLTESEIANRRLALLQSENGLKAASSRLLSILDVDSATGILPVGEMPALEPLGLDFEAAVNTALANRHDHLGALIDLEAAEINLRLAEDRLRWDLTLDANVSHGGGGETDHAVGLGLTISLGDRSPKLALVSAQNDLRAAKVALEELRQSIRIQVRQALYDAEVGYRLVELAQQAREFAGRKVEIEQRKLELGLTSTFQLGAVEDDLVIAQTGELDAGITYFNALSALDRSLGTTLQSWAIAVEDSMPRVDGLAAGSSLAERRCPPGYGAALCGVPGL